MHRFLSSPFFVRRLPRQSAVTKASSSRLLEYGRTLAGNEHPRVCQQSSFRRAFSGPSTTLDYPPFHRNSLRGDFGAYAEEYDRSLKDPEGFWAQAAKGIHWFESPTKILSQDLEKPYSYQWFSDGTTNTAYNCLDVHVDAGLGDRTAIIYDSPVTGVKQHISYKELLDQVSVFAGALKDELSVEPGDRVVIYMPMIPEAIVAMLACTRIGAVHSVVFGGFASHELANRITDCQPKVVISASAGVEPSRTVPYKHLLDKALEISNHSVERVVIKQRSNVEECQLGPFDVDFDDLVSRAQPIKAIPVPSTHPHYILYTSGTTGLPKGVVRDTGGWAVSLKYSMDHFYGMTPGDVFWAASDIGWVVGHAYIVYAPLLHGCTAILYEGKPVGTPDAGAFWRVISEHKVKALFAAPTAFRAIKQADPDAQFPKKYDLSSMETLFLAGEHSDPETIHWCERALPGIPTPIDHWWQTELGWPAVGNSVGLGRVPVRYGSCSLPVPGFDLAFFDEKGTTVPPNTLGNMAIKTPLPPGTLTTLYNQDERYVKDYLSKYPGYYETGDSAFVDDDGYVYIMGRTDDVINTAGHRLSTGSMEEILMEHPNVADCAVIPVNDTLKGQVPVGLVVCISGTQERDHDQIRQELIQLMRDQIGPVASFKKVGIVKALPKTRSGKTLRGTMSKIANGEDFKITPTIEDPTVFDHLIPAIKKLLSE